MTHAEIAREIAKDYAYEADGTNPDCNHDLAVCTCEAWLTDRITAALEDARREALEEAHKAVSAVQYTGHLADDARDGGFLQGHGDSLEAIEALLEKP